MNKIYNSVLRFVKENKLLVTTAVVAFLLLIPLLLLTLYASPAGDDFQHSQMMRSLLPSGYNLFQYSVIALKYSFSIYRDMQGAFTINLLIALNPLVYSLHSMPIVYILGFLFFIYANFSFSNALSKKILKGDIKTSLLITSVISIATLQFLPLSESFYWYAGYVGYILPYALALLFISNLIWIYNSKVLFLRSCVGVVLAFILGGTNFALCLFLLALGVSVAAVSLLRRDKELLAVISMNLALLVGFIINVMAPGNSTRMNWGFIKVSPVKAIIMSFWGSALSVGHVLSYTFIIFFTIILLIPVFKLIKNTSTSFRYPGLFSLISFCAISTLFTPAFYTGIGEAMPTRYSNMTTMIIVWALFINAFYWAGWALRNQKIEVESLQKNVLLLALMAIISLQVPLLGGNIDNFTSVKASREIVTEIVGNYRKEVNLMYSNFQNSVGKDVVFQIKTKPNSINPINIAADKAFWGNTAIAKYFGLKSIRSGE